MTQIRLWNYGDTFTSFRANAAIGALHPSGVFTGYDISLTDVDKFALSPGFLLLPNGLLVGDDLPIEMLVDPMPAAATTYTITVRHTDTDVIGGQAAVYALEDGELAAADIPDGLPIAYLYYPGFSVPLSLSYFVQAIKIPDVASSSPSLVPSSFSAPFPSDWLVSVAPSVNTSISDGYTAPYTFTKVETGGGFPAPPSFDPTTVVIPVRSGAFRPVSVEIKALVDLNSKILVSMLDTDGSSVLLTGATILPSAVFSDTVVSVDLSSGVFTEGDLYTLVLEFRTAQSESASISSIKVLYNPLP